MSKSMQKYVCFVLAVLFMAQGLVFALPSGETPGAFGPLAAFTAGHPDPVFLAVSGQPSRTPMMLLAQNPAASPMSVADFSRHDPFCANGRSSQSAAKAAPTLFALNCMLTV